MKPLMVYLCVGEVVLVLPPMAESPLQYRKGTYTPGTILVFDDIQEDGDWMSVHFPGMALYYYMDRNTWKNLVRIE